ncbi:MAG TPA: HRDC domain-containing protein, partial [Thermopolyspora sp.]
PGRRRVAAPITCRVCGRTLTTPREHKLGRCADCPAAYDVELLERLKAWRAATAEEVRVPAYVIFTDVTLQAIAERVPETTRDLALIAGVGQVKLDRYGAAVLAVCRGE